MSACTHRPCRSISTRVRSISACTQALPGHKYTRSEHKCMHAGRSISTCVRSISTCTQALPEHKYTRTEHKCMHAEHKYTRAEHKYVHAGLTGA